VTPRDDGRRAHEGGARRDSSEHGAGEAHLNVGLHLLLNAAAASAPAANLEVAANVADQIAGLRAALPQDGALPGSPSTTLPEVQTKLVASLGSAQTLKEEESPSNSLSARSASGAGRRTPANEAEAAMDVEGLREAASALEGRNIEAENASLKIENDALRAALKAAEASSGTTLGVEQEEAVEASSNPATAPIAAKRGLSTPPALPGSASPPMDSLARLGSSLANLFLKQDQNQSTGNVVVHV